MYVFVSVRRGWRGGWVDETIGLALYQICGNMGSVGRVLGLCCGGVGDVGGEWLWGLDQGLVGWGDVISVWVVTPDYMCRWQVQVSVYCAWRIHAHLMCTQCSIMVHLMAICFLPCICLLQISQIQTCLWVVVGPGFVSTSPAFMRTSASHPSGPHGRLAPKTVNRAPITGAWRFDRMFTAVCNRCDRFTTWRLCRLEPMSLSFSS